MYTGFLPLQDALAGEYSFERELGRGGMGVVYLARDVQLDRPVAIKVLPAALAVRDDVRARFLREARTAANLSHPNIVPIHRVGELGGIPFFVMTFVDGPTLGERLRERGPVSASTMTQILRDVAQALGYAHSRGIVHRDIKPDNILLDTATGRALVTDFGIAGIAGESGEGPVSGTVGFISPEQLAGAPVDGRSDLYSLGVVAHLALTGTMPDEGTANVASTGGLHQPLATAIARCLSPDPDARYADAESLVSALDATTAVARSSLPPELRAWAGDQVPMLPLYAFLTFTGVGTTVIASVSGFLGSRVELSAAIPISLGLSTLPAIPVLVYQLRKTRRALAEGYRLPDLRFALRTWRAERTAELNRGSETRLARIASWIPLQSAFLYVTSTVALLSPPPLVWPAVVLAKLSLFAGFTSLAALSVFGRPLVPKWLQRRMIGRARGWLWNSRLGSWLADRLAPKGGGVPFSAFRPTEMALEVAIDDLFAALPDEYRESLQELPAIARRLTARAAELREALTMDVSLESDPDHAWRKLKHANSSRLKETVTALERLRLGLLRLHGGMADLRPVTTALDAARAIDRDVHRLVEGQAEVSGVRRVLDFERRSPSPA